MFPTLLYMMIGSFFAVIYERTCKEKNALSLVLSGGSGETYFSLEASGRQFLTSSTSYQPLLHFGLVPVIYPRYRCAR
jgi:hypothetical protein